jgi:ATP-dependent helicase HrpA
MKFAVEDDAGAVVAYGDSLAELREQVRPLVRAAARGIERRGLTDWPRDFADRVDLPGAVGFPALMAEGEEVALRVFESREAQVAAHRTGVRRLLRMSLPAPPTPTDLIFASAEPGLLEDMAEAAAAALITELPWSEAEWRALRGHAAGRWQTAVRRVHAGVAEVLRAAADVRAMLERRPGDALRETRLDVARQLGRLLHPGFVTDAGVARLADLVRYLQAAERRLERAPDTLAQDRDHMRTLAELDALGADTWGLEELRVTYFAPALAKRGMSAKRLRTALQSPPS